jgi:hypothetical protein
MSLPTVPHDKALHFMYGSVIATVVMWCCYIGTRDLQTSAFFGLAVSTAAGIAKEIYDHFWQNGTAEVEDAILTTIGGLFVVAPGLL